MRLPAAWFPKTPIASVAVAIALVLPYGETRLYHDRFNLSGAPAFFGASPPPGLDAPVSWYGLIRLPSRSVHLSVPISSQGFLARIFVLGGRMGADRGLRGHAGDRVGNVDLYYYKYRNCFRRLGNGPQGGAGLAWP